MEKLEEKFFLTLQEHSSIKLKLLESYIVPWMRKVILGINGNCFICDTFAGTGYYEDGSKGSPIILINEAIECAKQIKTIKGKKLDKIVLVFVEKDDKNFKTLKENIENEILQEIEADKFNSLKDYPNIYLMISNSTHEEFIEELVSSVDKLIPSLIFIDPFGYKPIPLKSIGSLLSKYENCEVIVNFMYEEINRFFLKDDSNTFKQTLGEFYGDNIEDVKEKIKNLPPKERRDNIILGYKENLLKEGAKYTLDIDIFKGAKVKMNIIFATKNIYGFDTMKQVALDICGNTNYEFFAAGPQISFLDTKEYKSDEINNQITKYLFDKYSNNIVNFNKLKNDLMSHPIYPSCFLKSSLKTLEKQNKIKKVVKKDGSKRRNGTFPENCIVYFNEKI